MSAPGQNIIPVYEIGDQLFFQLPARAAAPVASAPTSTGAMGFLAPIMSMFSGSRPASTSTRVFFLVDASGSMTGVWKPLSAAINRITEGLGDRLTVLTFSSTAHEVDSRVLSSNINDHHCSGTCIWPGVQLLIKSIEERVAPNETATVVFVSDGEGESMDYLMTCFAGLPSMSQHLNFLCWGIGRGFPTGLAMALRDKLHRGPADTPPVFLMEEQSQIEQQATDIQGRFEFKATALSTAVRGFPWDAAPKAEGYSGSWVSIPAADAPDRLSMAPDEKLLAAADAWTLVRQPLTNEVAMALAKQWTGRLQLASLTESAESLHPRATIAVDLLRRMKDIVETKEVPQKEDLTVTVLKRLQKAQKGTVIDLATFINELEKIRMGDILLNLSDQERAQRLKIGTVTGKYHNKAMELRGLSGSDFTEMKKNFTTVLTEHPLPVGLETSQHASVVTLETVASVLSQADLATAVAECPSAFHWVEACPLVGQAVNIFRSQGSMINPYLLEIKSIGRVGACLDSLTLIENSGSYTLPTGDGTSETITAVVPLFNKAKDAALAPYLRTKLFHLLVHYQAVGNVDTFDGNSYLAILASLFWKLSREPESEWRSTLLSSVLDTVELAYGTPNWFRTYVDLVAKADARVVVTEHPDNVEGAVRVACENLTKPLLAAAVGGRLGNAVDWDGVARLIATESFGRFFAAKRVDASRSGTEDNFNIRTFFKLVGADPEAADPVAVCVHAGRELLQQNETAALYPAFQGFLTTRQLCDAVVVAIDRAEVPVDGEWRFEADRARTIGFGSFTVTAIEHALSAAAGRPVAINDETLLECFAHGINIDNSRERATTAVTPYNAAFDKVVLGLQDDFTKRVRAQAVVRLQEAVTAEWRVAFQTTHETIKPCKAKDLEALCASRALAPGALELSRSGNFRNACNCPACPHYLVPTNSSYLQQHLAGGYGHKPTPGLAVTLMKHHNEGLARVTALAAEGAELIGSEFRTQTTEMRRVGLDSITPPEWEVLLNAYADWTEEDIAEAARVAAENNPKLRK